MRLLVTRPRADSEPLADLLRRRGHDPLCEPLLDIVTVDGAPLEVDGAQALLFTSANGVRALVARNGDAMEAWRALPAYTVGDATARAARDAGFAQVESAAGDVTSLAALIASRRKPEDGALVHVAGSQVAGDLACLLGTQGFAVRREAIYEAKAAEALSEDAVGAIRKGEIAAALFFSPRTAKTFVELAAQADITPALGRVTAICLSPAVAETVEDLPGAASWRDILTAAEPTQDLMLAALDRFVERETRPKGVGGSVPPTSAPTPSVVRASEDAETSDASPVFEQPADAKRPAIGKSRWIARIVAALVLLILAGGAVLYQQRPDLVDRVLAFDVAGLIAGSNEQAASSSPVTPPSAPTPEAAPQDSPSPSEEPTPETPSASFDNAGSNSEAVIDALRRELAMANALLAEAQRDPVAIPPQEIPLELPQQPSAEISQELQQQLRSLEERLSRLADRPVATPQEIEGATEALESRLTRLDGALSSLADKLAEQQKAAVEERARLARDEAMIRQALRLRAALDNGAAFAADLPALQAFAAEIGAGDDATRLAFAAERGFAAPDDLRARLTEMANMLARNWPSFADGWIDRAWRAVSSQVVVRRLDDPSAALTGESPTDRRFARAERLYAEGDVAGARDALAPLASDARLPPLLQSELATWLRDVNARLAAEDLLAALLRRGAAVPETVPR